MSRLQKSILIVLIVALSGCLQNLPVTSEATTQAPSPTFPTYWAGTQTALASDLSSPTPLISETETALAALPQTPTSPALSPPSTFTPAVMEKPTDFSPVLYGGKLYDTTFFLLLGGVSRDAWLAPDESVARFSGEVTYSLHNMEYVDKYFLWGKTPEFSRTCKSYTIGTDAVLDEAGFVATLDSWTVTKRDVTELSENVEFYQQAVLDWLADKGITAPQPGTLQIFRVDVEGDGTDEVFISATHLDDSQHTTKAGDYSVVLMRKISGNDVMTKLIVGDVYDSKEPEITYPRTYSLANFIDLNQDGILEVVVDIQQWEGFGAIVFQIDGQDVIQSLRAEC